MLAKRVYGLLPTSAARSNADFCDMSDILPIIQRLAARPMVDPMLKQTGLGREINCEWIRCHPDETVRQANRDLVHAWKAMAGVQARKVPSTPASRFLSPLHETITILESWTSVLQGCCRNRVANSLQLQSLQATNDKADAEYSTLLVVARAAGLRSAAERRSAASASLAISSRAAYASARCWISFSSSSRSSSAVS